MKEDMRILAVDDDPDILLSLRLLLKNQVKEIITENNPAKVPELIKKNDFDIILLDMNFTKDTISGQEGFDLLDLILKLNPQMVVVFLTAYGDMDKAIKALKAGAVDFVLKPWQNEKLLATINSAAEISRSRKEMTFLKEKQTLLQDDLAMSFMNIIGRSESMKHIISVIKKVGPTDANVLITGENGTGKELIARALYQCSLRNKETFLSVDLGAITESLFESELFGHCKGAFTDAKNDRMGRFQAASGGTLFLDEIGNLSLSQQSKLLTAIEKQEIVRVGSNHPIPVNVRIISATNLSMDDLLQEQKFRQDLLYRINTIEIYIPPLRHRMEDIDDLLSYYLQIFSKKYNKNVSSIKKETTDYLKQYSWPGNVRELIHAIERAIILAESSMLIPEDFAFLINKHTSKEPLLNGTLDEIEKNRISECLKKHNGNVTYTAKELGLTRAALYRRMEKFEL